MKANPPNTDFPVGTPVTVVDAYGVNPVEGRVVRHYALDAVTVEDAYGVIYFAQTWRLTAIDLSLEEMLS